LGSPNDWEIRKCLVLCSSLFLAALVPIELANLGIDLPALRQLSGLLFLALVPGIIILRILKIHNISAIESLLYSIGLSIAFVMVIGVILNFALPPLGVSHPISVFSLIIAITIAILVLGIVAYKRDKSFIPTSPQTEKEEGNTKVGLGARLNPFLVAVLLPFLAILGTSLVNSHQNNALILVLIFTIASIIWLVAFNKFIQPQIYPFMIFMMAVSLFYQTTLISSYLVGSDIHLEYYLAKLVSAGGYWDASIANAVNSCLSIVILAPVYSLLLNMDIVWLFKIIYPLFFCLVPLALFYIFRLQMGARYAFLAAFFFISLPMFFMDMTQLVRQQISELFFVLVILLLVDRKLKLLQKTVLVLVFGFGVIVSYYGLGTGYVIGYLTLGMIVLIIIKSRPGRAVWQWIIGKSSSLPDDLSSAGAFNKKTLAVVISVSLVFMFLYYGIVASGAGASGIRITTGIAQSAIKGGGHLINSLSKEPLVQTAIGLDFTKASLGGKMWRILQYLVEFCLILGFLRLIFRPATLGKLKAEYISLTIVSALILLAIFVLPLWSETMGVTRIWQITLLIISPLFLFGGELIALGVVKLFKALRRRFVSLGTRLDCQAFTWFPVVVILLPYFIFNSGAVFELGRSSTTNFIDIPYSIALSTHRLDLNTVFTRQDLAAAHWLCKVPKEEAPVYTDDPSGKLYINQIDFPCNIAGITYDIPNIGSTGYVYLRAWNVHQNMFTFATGYATRQSVSFDDLPTFRQIMERTNRIYNNGSAQVLMLRKPHS
jgi:uncharacterized membrane protein